MDWLKNFDPEVGLWWSHRPAHTQPLIHLGDRVHPGPDAVGRLLLGGELGVLDRLPADRVIEMVARMQLPSPAPDAGGMKWYWEDPPNQSTDSNSDFFTALGLIALWHEYRDRLSQASQQHMRGLFTGLHRRFLSKHIGRRLFHCMNGIAGDLACAWLLTEILETQHGRDVLAGEMLDAFAYWRAEGFGFGEHLSNVYGRVSLTELSALLVFEQHLPPELRQSLLATINQLLAVDDAFVGGIRVPTIRCSALLQSPSVAEKYRDWVAGSYRQSVAPLTPDHWNRISNMPLLGGILARRRWHEKVAPPAPQRPDVRVPCMRSAQAIARLEPEVRLGTLSHFPIMPEAEFQTWGLAWQSFPAVFWHREGDWGFLQWETLEGPTRRCHPGELHEYEADKRGNPGPNAVLPPILGRTFALQRGGDALVLRLMPALAQSWLSVTDRFRLLDSPVALRTLEPAGPWRQALIERPGRTISLQQVQLTPGQTPRLDRQGNRQDWSFTFDAPTFLNGKQRMLVSLWGLSLNGPVAEPPVFTPAKQFLPLPRMDNETALELSWAWPSAHWRVRIDPLAERPLVDLNDD